MLAQGTARCRHWGTRIKRNHGAATVRCVDCGLSIKFSRLELSVPAAYKSNVKYHMKFRYGDDNRG